MILSAFFRAIGQLSDPRFLGVLGLGVGLTLALLIGFYLGFVTLVGWFVPDSFTLPWLGEITWAETAIGWAAVPVFLLLSMVLMVPVASAFMGVFLERVADAVEDAHYPGLPPARPIGLLEGRIGDRRDLLLAGSSLGGYYATWLAGRFDLPAVLVNPSVRPYETLAPCVGPVENWCTGETFQWRTVHIEQLRALADAPEPDPGRLLVLVQTGDEILDYREALRRYADQEVVIERGGSHAFEGFSRQLGRIAEFHRRHLGPL